jgi:probable rRNA maturation factor
VDVRVEVRNESPYRGLVRRDVLGRIATRVLEAERPGAGGVLSVLLCDDAEMAALNRRYRKVKGATDVLSFEAAPAVADQGFLGDIVISLETVARRNAGDPDAMRAEVRLLFCHGLLHLLGYEHRTADERREMVAKQAAYLGISEQAAWLGTSQNNPGRRKQP